MSYYQQNNGQWRSWDTGRSYSTESEARYHSVLAQDYNRVVHDRNRTEACSWPLYGSYPPINQEGDEDEEEEEEEAEEEEEEEKEEEHFGYIHTPQMHSSIGILPTPTPFAFTETYIFGQQWASATAVERLYMVRDGLRASCHPPQCWPCGVDLYILFVILLFIVTGWILIVIFTTYTFIFCCTLIVLLYLVACYFSIRNM